MRALALVAALLSGGINFIPGTQVTFTDCSSGGSVAQTITSGSYAVTVTDSDTFLCLADSASTCASGGIKLPLGSMFIQTFGPNGQSASCRSGSSTGDVQFTKVTN